MENKKRPKGPWVRTLGYVRVGDYKGVLYQNIYTKNIWKWRSQIVKADTYVSAIQQLRDKHVIPKELMKIPPQKV